MTMYGAAVQCVQGCRTFLNHYNTSNEVAEDMENIHKITFDFLSFYE